MHPHRHVAASLVPALLVSLLAACGQSDPTPPPALTSFTATPAALPFGGGQVVLAWTASNASALTLDNGVGDVTGTSTKTVSVALTTTFTLTATGSGGVRTATATVTVAPAPPPAPTITTFTATPATLPVGGGTVTLRWTTTNATALSLDNGVGDVTGQTSKVVTVTVGKTFKLTATNAQSSATATAAVTVAAVSLPTITSFTATPGALRYGGGDVTLAWTVTQAASLTIDHGVGAVTGSSTVASVPASTTFKLTATNATGSAEQTATVSVETSFSCFVDVANGSDAGTCTQAAPCKTLTKAMAGAPAGTVCTLADGTYAPATEGYNAVIPDGVTLRARNPGGAVLNSLILSAAGSFALEGLVFDRTAPNGCTRITAKASTGAPTLTVSGVFFKCMGYSFIGALNLGGNVKATITPGALAGGLYSTGFDGGPSPLISIADASELVITGGILDGNNTGQPAFGGAVLVASGTSKLTLDGVTVRNRKQSILALAGSSSGVLRNGTLFDKVGVLDNCASGGVIVLGAGSLLLDHAQISNTAGAAICLRNNATAATVQVLQSTITNTYAAAIQNEPGATPAVALTLDGSSLTANDSGLNWTGRAGSTFDVRNSTLTGNRIGATVTLGAGTFTLRGSSLSNNTSQGLALSGGLTVDLGKTSDPGGNTFLGNGTVGLQDNLDAGHSVDAVGNTWIASQQGADAAGRYSTPPGYVAVPVQGPTSGTTKNFSIANAALLGL